MDAAKECYCQAYQVSLAHLPENKELIQALTHLSNTALYQNVQQLYLIHSPFPHFSKVFALLNNCIGDCPVWEFALQVFVDLDVLCTEEGNSGLAESFYTQVCYLPIARNPASM